VKTWLNFELSVLTEQGDKYAAFLHDAVILYAIALNETYRKGQDVNSGTVVAKNCRGKFFKGSAFNMSVSYVFVAACSKFSYRSVYKLTLSE
jgi:hypothetical protein